MFNHNLKFYLNMFKMHNILSKNNKFMYLTWGFYFYYPKHIILFQTNKIKE